MITLGQLIETLEALPGAARVRFDYGAFPNSFASWRGDYSQLTLVPGGIAPGLSVAGLLKQAHSADGGVFEAWKGGEYTMRRDTPVWADPRGEAYGHTVQGFAVKGGVVVVKTARHVDYLR